MGPSNKARRQQLLAEGEKTGWRMLNLGSGGRRNRHMINLDITPLTEPDVVGDGHCMPFADGFFDVIFCDYVIEHVDDPERFLAAVRRSLKPGGRFYLEVPFLQPQHASPYDFSRWTKAGFASALVRAGYEVEDSGTHIGPGFALFWLLKESLALLLSIGAPKLRGLLSYLLSWILWPIFLVDFFSVHLPGVEAVACGFYFVAKPSETIHEGRQ